MISSKGISKLGALFLVLFLLMLAVMASSYESAKEKAETGNAYEEQASE